MENASWGTLQQSAANSTDTIVLCKCSLNSGVRRKSPIFTDLVLFIPFSRENVNFGLKFKGLPLCEAAPLRNSGKKCMGCVLDKRRNRRNYQSARVTLPHALGDLLMF